jgi:hypothetical protein
VKESRSTQRGRILQLLIATRGDWVPLPTIADCAAQYNARIHELRRLGFLIENRTKRIDGVKHSWFRLARGPEQLAPTAEPDRMVKASEWLSVARGESMPVTGSLFGDLSPDRSYIE